MKFNRGDKVILKPYLNLEENWIAQLKHGKIYVIQDEFITEEIPSQMLIVEDDHFWAENFDKVVEIK